MYKRTIESIIHKIYGLLSLGFSFFLALIFIVAFGFTDWSWLKPWGLLVLVLFVLWLLMYIVSKTKYSIKDNQFIFNLYGIKRVYKSSSYDFAIISSYTYKGRYLNGVRLYDNEGKIYPSLSVYKAQGWYHPIRTGMTDQSIKANQKDRKDQLFVGICWPTVLETVLHETDLIVYILEDIYLSHKDCFDTEITKENYEDRIFIVTDRNISYKGYLPKQS